MRKENNNRLFRSVNEHLHVHRTIAVKCVCACVRDRVSAGLKQ